MPSGRISARRADRRSAIFVASALLHLGLLALLAEYLSRSPTLAESPGIQVVLLRPEPPPVARAPQDAPPPRLAGTRRAPDTPPFSASAPPLEPGARSTGGPADDPTSGNGQRTLRGLASCGLADLARMSPEEREECQTRRWARTGAASPRLDLDPRGRYAENPEPYLTRRPKDGCRVRAAGDVDPMGDSGNARAGIGCALSF